MPPTAESDSDADHDRQRDIRRVAKLLRDGGYTYDQSKHLIAEARKAVGLKPPKRKKGSVERLTLKEVDELLEVAYEKSARRGLMLRILLETATRVSAFCRLRVQNISLREREIQVQGKGDKKREIPILESLVRELRQHLDGRESGYVFPSPRGGHYSPRRIQQIVGEVADEAEIPKRVYPHLLRHTMAQRLAGKGMPENLLQRFLGHDHPQTTQVYYEPSRPQVKQAFQEAMQ